MLRLFPNNQHRDFIRGRHDADWQQPIFPNDLHQSSAFAAVLLLTPVSHAVIGGEHKTRPVVVHVEVIE